MLLTIVVPTLGRKKELRDLLDSISFLPCGLFEVVIVDQNEEGFLEGVFDEYSFCIDYYNVDFVGVSKARNFALSRVNSQFVLFCDDDAVVEKRLIEYLGDVGNDMDMVAFRVCDLYSERNCMVDFPVDDTVIDEGNFHSITLEVSQVWNVESIRLLGGYDEKLGVGTYFGADEGIDLLVRALEAEMKMLYLAKTGFRHPLKEESGYKRYYQYARGTGRFFRKHCRKPYVFKYIAWLLVKSMIGVGLYLFYRPNKSLKYCARLMGFVDGYSKSGKCDVH
ncbi:glycosyltransferase family 2 protein [Halomonas caseinilytica]|uniref:glycosyltransferase family 2 protein n=1 Tax=Halomonas caseinilytica TaxID=438744 RepID=UPI0009F6D382|nr:glycosyltransferase family 2 protein [Halomonas caseinilytica]